VFLTGLSGPAWIEMRAAALLFRLPLPLAAGLARVQPLHIPN
jgi:hypothetical protein